MQKKLIKQRQQSSEKKETVLCTLKSIKTTTHKVTRKKKEKRTSATSRKHIKRRTRIRSLARLLSLSWALCLPLSLPFMLLFVCSWLHLFVGARAHSTARSFIYFVSFGCASLLHFFFFWAHVCPSRPLYLIFVHEWTNYDLFLLQLCLISFHTNSFRSLSCRFCSMSQVTELFYPKIKFSEQKLLEVAIITIEVEIKHS